MKQLSLFEDCTPPEKPPQKNTDIWRLCIDGAARKNPGIAGAGFYVTKNDIPLYKKGFFLGERTNNQAEYYALLLGLFWCKKHLEEPYVLYIISDSELLVKQMKGEYSIKNALLRPLYNAAQDLLQGMNVSLCHVKRELNKEADAMANVGIDKGCSLPAEFLTFLKKHAIIF